MGLAFFILAYAELFSGGTNLPGGPITEFTGAVNNFLVPQWPLIGVYAYHGMLLSLLIVITIIDLDGQKVPRSFVLFGGLVGLLTGMLGVHPWLEKEYFRLEELKIGAAFAFAFIGACCGLLAGSVSIALWQIRLEKVQKKVERKEASSVKLIDRPFSKAENLMGAFVLAGVFLGGLVLWYAVVCTVVLLALTRGVLPKKRWGLCKLALPVFLCVIVVLIAAWETLQSSMPF